MTPLRFFGWILLLASWLAGGCAPHGEAGMPQKARRPDGGAVQAPTPAPATAVTPVRAVPERTAAAEELPPAWPWVLDDDEFEGEGWTFWPLEGPRR